MKDMTGLDPAVQLLTILNVQSTQTRRKKRSDSSVNPSSRDWHSIAKKARTGSTARDLMIPEFASPSGSSNRSKAELSDQIGENEDDEVRSLLDDEEQSHFDQHWGRETITIASADQIWSKRKYLIPGLGRVTEFNLPSSPALPSQAQSQAQDSPPHLNSARLHRVYNARLLERYQQNLSQEVSSTFRQSWLAVLSSYKDLLYPKVNLDDHEQIRASLALHAMNHVSSTRSRVLKNNEKLSKHASETSLSSKSAFDSRDQGFTRPKVLILAPFRNSALKWVELLTKISQADTIENKTRFETEYALPEGASDRLADHPEDYPADHVATFAGNIDDNFRVGLKVTRKSIKLFSDFYSCDVIVASPLGLRTSVEKEGDNSDFLSSIELLVVDQMDVMTMQNWEHVLFVMDRLNKVPVESHGCDFSRVKPWYLDGHARHLRQSVLLSSFETPEMRSLFNRTLSNFAGKIRADLTYGGVLAEVPKGIKQVFTRFEVADIYSEDDARFEYFKTKTVPMLRRSAVSSSQTIIFVPSYFDFVRVKKYLRTLEDLSFSSISEYTPTPDVSRARGAFFSGETSFLLVTERFHFFRRYRLRGAKTFVFYAPPDHADFYTEVLSFPLVRPGGSAGKGSEAGYDGGVDESELSSQLLFSKFDLLRLERICGSGDASKMVNASAGSNRFTFLF